MDMYSLLQTITEVSQIEWNRDVFPSMHPLKYFKGNTHIFRMSKNTSGGNPHISLPVPPAKMNYQATSEVPLSNLVFEIDGNKEDFTSKTTDSVGQELVVVEQPSKRLKTITDDSVPIIASDSIEYYRSIKKEDINSLREYIEQTKHFVNKKQDEVFEGETGLLHAKQALEDHVERQTKYLLRKELLLAQLNAVQSKIQESKSAENVLKDIVLQIESKQQAKRSELKLLKDRFNKEVIDSAELQVGWEAVNQLN